MKKNQFINKIKTKSIEQKIYSRIALKFEGMDSEDYEKFVRLATQQDVAVTLGIFINYDTYNNTVLEGFDVGFLQKYDYSKQFFLRDNSFITPVLKRSHIFGNNSGRKIINNAKAVRVTFYFSCSSLVHQPIIQIKDILSKYSTPNEWTIKTREEAGRLTLDVKGGTLYEYDENTNDKYDEFFTEEDNVLVMHIPLIKK